MRITNKKAIQLVQEGKKVIYRLYSLRGFVGSLKQSFEIQTGLNEYALKHKIDCLKYDNKPYEKAGFEILA